MKTSISEILTNALVGKTVRTARTERIITAVAVEYDMGDDGADVYFYYEKGRRELVGLDSDFEIVET